MPWFARFHPVQQRAPTGKQYEKASACQLLKLYDVVFGKLQ
jgi:hypothetical protein